MGGCEYISTPNVSNATLTPLERSDLMECLENNANKNHHEAGLTVSDGYTNNDTFFILKSMEYAVF